MIQRLRDLAARPFRLPLRERNPVLVGVVGTAVLVGVLAAVILLPKISLFSSDRGYSALFAQAAGINSGDEVRVAGIPAGTVTGVRLDGAAIRVDFDVTKSDHLGSLTTASIEVATLLGTKYVELTPAGPGSLSTGHPIPLARTQVPFDLAQVTTGLERTVSGLDIPTLRKALDTVSTAFAHTPNATRQALHGLSGIARVITKRQAEFTQLLAATRHVTTTLAAQRGNLDALFRDADQVLRTVRQRRAIIHDLLTDSASLGHQLSRLVGGNRAALDPLLSRLNTIAALLHRDQHSLGRAVGLLAPATRGLANATGTGPFVSVNLPYLFLPDNVLCAFSIAKDCR